MYYSYLRNLSTIRHCYLLCKSSRRKFAERMITLNFKVNYEIKNIAFPSLLIPIESGPGSGYVNITNMKLEQFDSPKFQFKLVPPNGIAWKSVNGSFRIIGDWEAVYDILIPVGFLFFTISALTGSIGLFFFRESSLAFFG